MKTKLVEYLEENYIIDDNLHGERKCRSTMTCKAAVDVEIVKNYEEEEIVTLISTDVSAGFVKFDHGILCKKLFFHGIRGKDL